jgi:hypothetical protein
MRYHKNHRKGAMVVLSAFLLMVLFAFVAFSIDVGYIVHGRTELQRTADACAMAAATRLPNKDEARAIAKQVALDNAAIVGPPLSDSEIEFGIWDRDTATFISPPPSGQQAAAVRITLARTAAKGNPLNLFFGRMVKTETADASATAIAMMDHNLCGPFIGIQWIHVPGTPNTDSFNSSQGPYNPASAGDRGSLCSDGPINIDGNPYVRGDARAGKGYNVTLTGNAVITGNIGSRIKPLNMPPVDTSSVAANNDNPKVPKVPKGNGWASVIDANRNFLLDGTKILDMPAGTYYFNDMTLTGMATLNITGPVKIYLTGNLYRAGGVTVNVNSKTASSFQIYMTGGTANVTSNNDFYGVIYGPNTAVTIDGASDLFGAIVGKTLTISGTGFAHYDEALGLLDDAFPMRSALVH